MYDWSYVLEMPDIDFIRPCGVVVFALFYCRLDLCCCECYVGCLLFEYFPIYVSVCFVCLMFDCVGELLVECVCYLCGWGECFLFESYGVIFGLCFLLLANPCIVFQRVRVLCL